jgi:hypothetical protein
MSLLKLPVEIVSLLVELLDVEDVFNMALSCRFLSCILYDRRMCRLALEVCHVFPCPILLCELVR